MISQKTIQQVFEVSQVDDLIQDYVNLKRRGVNMIGLCPFHDEKTPSFTVSPTKNIYKCFGCGKGGGPIQFLMDHDQLSYPEAIRFLAKRYNIELEETNEMSQEDLKEKQLSDSLLIVNEFALQYFESNLWETDEGKSVGLSYFKERGFRENTIRKFQLGYAKNSYDHFTKIAVDKKYNIEHLRTVGLTSRKDLDFFRDRVMFTISNVSGKPIAFAGRSLTTDKKSPKYINSPESVIYNKRKILYGIHLAKAAIRKQDVCYLVEGYTDVISLHQGGVENVVASSGTALTEQQVRLVKRYTDNITLLYDGDIAGVKAAMRGMDIILSQGLNVQLVILPDGEDPDSFMRAQGKSGFEQFIQENGKDFLFFKTQLILEESEGDPIKKAKLLREIITSLSMIKDSIKRAMYIKECGQRLEIQEEILVTEVNKAIREDIQRNQRQKRIQAARQHTQQPQTDEPPLPNEEPGFQGNYEESDWISQNNAEVHSKQNVRVQSDEFQEKDIARIAMTMGDQLMYVDEKQEEQLSVASFIYSSIYEIKDFFDHPIYKQILEESYAMCEKGTFTHAHFINHSNPEIAALSVEFLTTKYEYANWRTKEVYLQSQKAPDENFNKDSLQSILRFKYRKIRKVLQQLKERIRTQTTENDEEGLLLSLKAFNTLQTQRKIIAEKLGVIIG